MRKLIKYVSYLLIVLIVVIAALLTYVKTALPDVGEPEDLKIEYTAEQLNEAATWQIRFQLVWTVIPNATSPCFPDHLHQAH